MNAAVKLSSSVDLEKAIYEKYYYLVLSTCKRRLYESSMLEDAVQSTFLLYLEEKHRITTQLSSWFYWASVNVCKAINTTAQKQSLIQSKLKLQDGPSEVPTEDEKSVMEGNVDKILEQLPSKYRTMILMRYYDKMTYREIAIKFNCKEDNVRKTIDRSLLSLRKRLGQPEAVYSSVLSGLFCQTADVSNIPAFSVSQKISATSMKYESIVFQMKKLAFYSNLKYAFVVIVCLSTTGLLLFKNVHNTTAASHKAIAQTINPVKTNGISESSGLNESISSRVGIDSSVRNIADDNKSSKKGKEPALAPIDLLLGVWVLENEDENYPHKTNSRITMNSNRTFIITKEDGDLLLTNPLSTGNYDILEDVIVFQYPGNHQFKFKYETDGKSLSLENLSKGYLLSLEKIKE